MRMRLRLVRANGSCHTPQHPRFSPLTQFTPQEALTLNNIGIIVSNPVGSGHRRLQATVITINGTIQASEIFLLAR